MNTTECGAGMHHDQLCSSPLAWAGVQPGRVAPGVVAGRSRCSQRVQVMPASPTCGCGSTYKSGEANILRDAGCACMGVHSATPTHPPTWPRSPTYNVLGLTILQVKRKYESWLVKCAQNGEPRPWVWHRRARWLENCGYAVS